MSPQIDPKTLTYIGWALEVVIFLLGLGAFVHFLVLDTGERHAAQQVGLPSGVEIRDGSINPARFGECPTLCKLVETIQTRYRRGYLQEEAILATLEDEVQSRGETLRDLSALAILAALFFTFLTLFITLRKDNRDPLPAALALVGVNFPGVGAGMLLFGAATWARRNNQNLLQKYRDWLEASVFPELGGPRSTADHLTAALRNLSDTTQKLTDTIGSVAQIREFLQQFQSELLLKMVSQVTEVLRVTPLALSKESMKELHSISVESIKLFHKISQDYGKLVLNSDAAERRNVQILDAINSTCSHVDKLGSSTNEATGLLSRVASSMTSLADTVRMGGADLHAFHELIPQMQNRIVGAGEQVNALRTSLESAAGATASLTARLDELQSEVVSHRQTLSSTRDSADGLKLSISDGAQRLAEGVETLKRLTTELEDRSRAIVASANHLVESIQTSASAAGGALVKTTSTLVEAAVRVDNAATSASVALVELAKALAEQRKSADIQRTKELVDALLLAVGDLGKQVTTASNVISQLLEALGPAVEKQNRVFTDINESLRKSNEQSIQLGKTMAGIKAALARSWWRKLTGRP